MPSSSSEKMSGEDCNSMTETTETEPKPAVFIATKRARIPTLIAMILWLGSIHLIFLIIIASLLFLHFHQFLLVMGLFVMLMVIPISETSKLATSMPRFIYKHVWGYFPVTLHVEDINAFNPNQAYVFGYEPHSVWPLAAGVLTQHTGFMPLPKIRILASSAVFYTPLLRHLWTWLGVSAITKTNFAALLASGYSCIIVPGGVQEAFYMDHDRSHEVVFLTKRKGFIRLAMEANCPLVPVFAFGESYVYKWWKPRGELFLKFSRAIRFTPMIFSGIFGSPIPYRQSIYVAVGKPIHFKKNLKPTMEEVSEVQRQFIEALRVLFDKHKAKAGYPNLELRIL